MALSTSNLLDVACRVTAHRRFPLALSLAAVVLMLPALGAGLFMDDWVQRTVQFQAAELPSGLLDTGFVSHDCGELGTVLCDLFGLPRREAAAARARDYGLLPWWAPEGIRAAVWRPFSAFTHWVDYRLFPNSPALMHAHSIAWYGLAVFLVAVLYRKIWAWTPNAVTSESTPSGAVPTSFLAAGFAGFLFLLDKNTYFPVMFVANRGFIISLVFGLLCLHAHYHWRTTGSVVHMCTSAACFGLSLCANEGGASTLAFLAAYALVLEPGDSAQRVRSLVPAAVVLVAWRAVYVSWGFGVRLVGGYVDPGYEPFLFLKQVGSRVNALLAGQITGLIPEVTLLASPEMRVVLALLFVGVNFVFLALVWPILRRDRVMRFWATAMLLALVPAATVAPLSKNMGFIAVAGFGVIASFIHNLLTGNNVTRNAGLFRAVGMIFGLWLLIAHIPGALIGRTIMAVSAPLTHRVMARWCGFQGVTEIGGRKVVIVNNPSTLTSIAAPFYRAYHQLPLPTSIRNLVPGSNPFRVRRLESGTLVLEARAGDLFGCPRLGSVHLAYLFQAVNEFLFLQKTWAPGERVSGKEFIAEVLEVGQRGLPSAIAFRFDGPLESDERIWLYFDWRSRRYVQFGLPAVGQTIEIPGAERSTARPDQMTALRLD